MEGRGLLVVVSAQLNSDGTATRDPTDLVGREFYSSELRDDDVMIEFASAKAVPSKK